MRRIPRFLFAVGAAWAIWTGAVEEHPVGPVTSSQVVVVRQVDEAGQASLDWEPEWLRDPDGSLSQQQRSS